MNRFLLSLSSGLLFALGWPTYGFPLFLFFAFVPLLVIEVQLRQSNIKRKGLHVFGYAYLSFFIWNICTTSWLWYADPFGASFAVLVNSLLMATVFRIYHGMAKRGSQMRALVFLVALWLSFEKMHLIWEFSWPWLNLGNGFSEFTSWIQWYEYTGTFGGSLWIWVSNALAFLALLNYKKVKTLVPLKRAALQWVLLFSLPLIISLVIGATYRASEETIEVVLLQPNIDPYSEKYNTSNEDMAELLLGLADAEVTDSTAFIIAPETVFAQGVRLPQFDYSPFKTILDTYLSAHPNTNILTGVSFYDTFTEPSRVRSETNRHPNGFWYDDYNSAVLLNTQRDYQKYDKSKLVVGVENFPYQGILKPMIGEAMIDLGGTVAMKTTQEERSVFTGVQPQHRAAPIICYESVYGEFVTGYVRNGANFLAIITNDAWWNETQGHKQHLSYARLRAIETRRSIARSANTGISALINPKGEIVASLGYDKQGALKGRISLNETLSFYTLAGDYIARIALFVLIFVFLIIRFRKKRL